jgi:hypothetical protein
MYGVAASAMTEALRRTFFAETHGKHHVTQGWPGFGQIFLFGDAELLSDVDDVDPANNFLKQTWREELDGWEFPGVRVPADEDDIFVDIALFDSVDDISNRSPRVCRLGIGSKGKRRMWLASSSALDVEAVGLDLVPIHEVLRIEGYRRERPGKEVGGR